MSASASDHTGHLVKWVPNEGKYRLFCIACAVYTAHETAEPNYTGLQRFEEATARPEQISVTLSVQPLKHKQQRRF